MRVVLICRTYPTLRKGGMGNLCQDRAVELAKQGHDVHVLTTGGPESIEAEPLTVHHLNCKRCEYTDEFARECSDLVSILSPDVVHMDSFDSARPWWIGIKPPVSVTMNGFSFGAFLSAWNVTRVDGGEVPVTFKWQGMYREREILAKAHRVIGVSEHEAWILRDPFGLPNVSMIRNPIARCFFDQPTVPPPARRVFCCAAVVSSGYRRFRVARKLAKELESVCHIAEDLDREAMPGFYDRSSALVCPNLYAQGSDLTIDESLSRGRPVIAWATGSMYWDDRKGIIKVPPGDRERLKAAMAGELPTLIPDGVTNRPEYYVRKWLNAVS